MLKRLAAILLIFIFLMCGCTGGSEELPGQDALILYDSFLEKLSGADIIRFSVGFDEPISLMRPSREEISFFADNGRRVMTYRAYNPLIFWNTGPADYFDGKNYYYKYKDDWFVDNYGRFSKRLEPEFLGIPGRILNRDNILSSGVYRKSGGYRMEIVSENPDKGLVYTIKCSLDNNFYINRIKIEERKKDAGSELIGYYTIKYKNIGKQYKIKPPQGLELSEMEYLRQYYHEQAQQAVPAEAAQSGAETAQ